MKKTIKISLGREAFYVDDDAYEKLRAYLSAIGARLKGNVAGEEIIEDMESRIGELFSERLSGTREVVTVDDVIYVISVLGDPSEIIDEEEVGREEVSQKGKKRLYRDPGNAVIGGVCGGLGSYFNIDPVWFRILFVILLPVYGISLWLYIVLWIVVSEARSSSQRLKMSGEKITIENIEKSVKEEYTKVKGRLKNQASHTRNGIQRIFRGLGQFLLGILRVIVIIMGISFILIGFFSLIAFVGTLLFKHGQFDIVAILHHITDPVNISYIIISFAGTLLIPLLALTYFGFKMVFRIQAKDAILWAIAAVLWFISAVTFFSFGISEATYFANHVEFSEKKWIPVSHNTTLYLKINDSFRPDLEADEEIFSVDDYNIYQDENSGKLYGEAEISIQKAQSDSGEIKIWRSAMGKNRRDAFKNAEMIHYDWEQKDSLLLLDAFYVVGDKKYWRAENVDIQIKVPVNTKVIIGKDLAFLLHHAEGLSHRQLMDLADKECIMTEEGLQWVEK